MSEKKSKDLRKRHLKLFTECPSTIKGFQNDKQGRRVLLSLIRQGKLPESACPKRGNWEIKRTVTAVSTNKYR